MDKTSFWKRWELFVPLEPLEELKLEPPENNKTNIVKNKEPTDRDDVIIYKKSKRRRKMYCNCKNCSANIFSEMKVENEPKPKVEPSNKTKYKKESEYDPKGFTELDKNLNISTLTQNKIQNSDEFQRIIDNVAANTSYCNEIMKAEMDKLGIQNLTLEESKKVPKLKQDVISATAKIDKAMKKEHEHSETQRDQVIGKENPKTKNSHTGKPKHKRLVLILQPDTEENVKPKTNLRPNTELSQHEGNIDNNSSQRFEKEEVDQIMLMFKLMDTRKKYKKMQNEVKLSTTRKEFMDLQMKLLQAKMEMEIIKRQMYCI